MGPRDRLFFFNPAGGLNILAESWFILSSTDWSTQPPTSGRK